MDPLHLLGSLLVGYVLLSFLMFSGRGPRADLCHRWPWLRWFNRMMLLPWCYLLAACPLVSLGDALGTMESPSAWLLLVPLAPAGLLLVCLVRLQRVMRGGRWQPGAPIPWPQPVMPAVLRPRRRDFSPINLADPAMVEELARSHWQVLHEALREGVSTDWAERMQRAFLRHLLLHPDRPLAEAAASVYRRAMIGHALDAQRAMQGAPSVHLP